MPSPLPLLLAGGAALLLLGGKKKRARGGGSVIVFEDEDVIGGGVSLSPAFNDVSFSPEMNQYKIGGGWTIKTLDAWLDKRRRAGLLATVNHDEGWLYTLLVDDPTTWLGDLTGTGKTGGAVIYGSLWLMATVGIGIYASGFAAASANIQAATQAANATRAMQILGPRATQLAGQLYKKGFGASQIALALRDFGGMESLARYGVSRAIAGFSGGAAGLGVSMAAALLAEIGVNAAFSEDLAASATEAAAEFSLSHTVEVSGERIPIALLPSSDAYPAVQDFNKRIMGYIIKFQKSHFED